MRFLSTIATAVLVAAPAYSQSITQPSLSPEALGGIALPGAIGGRFLTTPVTAALSGQAVGAANRLYATPVFIGSSATLSSMSFRITTGNASAYNVRMCLYADAAGVPGALVKDSGTVAVGSGSVTGTQTAGSLATAVPGPAWYWAGIMFDNNGESVNSVVSSNGSLIGGNVLAGPSAGNVLSGTYTTGIFGSQTFGACPAAFPAITYNDSGSTPAVALGF